MHGLDAPRPLRQQFQGWKRIAARDGAITLYNYAETKQAIETLLSKCPSLFAHLDRETYRKAGKTFEQSFPDYADVRLSVAHSGKIYNSPVTARKHAIDGKIREIHNMNGRILTSSINGKRVSYELSEAAAVTLHQITEVIFDAYRPIEEYSCSLSEPLK